MIGVALTLAGTLSVRRVEDGTNTEVPQVFRPTLLSTNLSIVGGSEISQKPMTINSPSAFVALAFPGTLRGRVIYFRPINGTFVGLQITHATAGVVVHGVNGLFIAEFGETEQISALGVKGVGSFEWLVAGVLV